MLLHDFDGDGDLDMIGASRKRGQSYDASIKWIQATLGVYANLGRARSTTAAPFFEAVNASENPFAHVFANVTNYHDAASFGSQQELTFTFFDIDGSGFDDLVVLGSTQSETNAALATLLNPAGVRYWRTLEVFLNNGLAAPSRRYVKVEHSDAAYVRWGFANIYKKEEFPTGAFTFYDVDGDGAADIVWGRGDGSFDTHLNNGTRLEPSWSTEALSQSSSLNAFSAVTGGGGAGGIFADVNGDGHADLVTTTQHTRDGLGGAQARLFLNDGAGHFPKESIGRGNPFYDVYDGESVRLTFADMDGDGEDDVIASSGGDGAVFIIFARWAGRFGTDIAGRGAFNPLDSVSFNRDSFCAPATGDVNGDGYNDIIASSGRGMALFLGGSTVSGASSNFTYTEDATFDSVFPYVFTGYHHQRPFLYDTDGDGDLDLILTGPAQGSLVPPCSVKLFLNDGSGGFTLAVSNPFAAVNPGCMTALNGGSDVQFGQSVLHDVTGDGLVDLVVAVANGINVFLNEGPVLVFTGPPLAANLNPLREIPVGQYESSASDIGIAFHDLTGDGFDDLIIAQSSYDDERGRSSLSVHALHYAIGASDPSDATADRTFDGKPTWSASIGVNMGAGVSTGQGGSTGAFASLVPIFRLAFTCFSRAP